MHTNTCLLVAFQRSSKCDHAHCVEVGAAADRVFVRDSKLPRTAPVLSFRPDAWGAFVAGIKAGDF